MVKRLFLLILLCVSALAHSQTVKLFTDPYFSTKIRSNFRGKWDQAIMLNGTVISYDRFSLNANIGYNLGYPYPLKRNSWASGVAFYVKLDSRVSIYDKVSSNLFGHWTTEIGVKDTIFRSKPMSINMTLGTMRDLTIHGVKPWWSTGLTLNFPIH